MDTAGRLAVPLSALTLHWDAVVEADKELPNDLVGLLPLGNHEHAPRPRCARNHETRPLGTPGAL
jgi:hypothetical protein